MERSSRIPQNRAFANRGYDGSSVHPLGATTLGLLVTLSFKELHSQKNQRATTKGQNRTFPFKTKGLAQGDQKRSKDKKEQDKSMLHVSCCTFVLLLFKGNDGETVTYKVIDWKTEVQKGSPSQTRPCRTHGE